MAHIKQLARLIHQPTPNGDLLFSKILYQVWKSVLPLWSDVKSIEYGLFFNVLEEEIFRSKEFHLGGSYARSHTKLMDRALQNMPEASHYLLSTTKLSNLKAVLT